MQHKKNSTHKKEVWFKHQKYGVGWYPIHPLGYLVLMLYTLDVYFTVSHYISRSLTWANTIMMLGLLLLYTAVILFICLAKGEKGSWSWN